MLASLEWIVDFGENGRAFTGEAKIDKADDER
jgi:hypothetical protein